MIKRKRFFKIYVPCRYFMENSAECKNCTDRHRCRRIKENNPASSRDEITHIIFCDLNLENPYEKYLMGD